MPRDIEGPIHRQIVTYLRAVLPPECIIHHSANEGVRGGKRGILDGAKRKAMGQVPGFPDIIVLPFSTIGPMFFEVKAPKGRVSDAQSDVLTRLDLLGYRHAVVRSVDDARRCLRMWSIPTREVEK